jgi:very-short-patch-repair endonuclease
MERLVPFGRVQYGLVERSQACAAGVPERTIDGWAASGQIEVVHAGVYLLPGSRPCHERSALAAVLGAGDGAVASHRTAARFWGWLSDRTIEVSVDRPCLPRMTDVVVHRSRDLADRWITSYFGVPTTNPARTLVDLGAVVRPWRVADCLERALIARHVTIEQMEDTYDRLKRRGRNGTGVLRAVLDDRALGAARADSILEVRMARLLRDYGLPPAQFQYQISSKGRFYGQVDFAFPDLMVAIEVDGWEAHGTPNALRIDLNRQNEIEELGWRVRRFTWFDVVKRPASVAARLRRYLGAETATCSGKRTQNGEPVTDPGPSPRGR